MKIFRNSSQNDSIVILCFTLRIKCVPNNLHTSRCRHRYVELLILATFWPRNVAKSCNYEARKFSDKQIDALFALRLRTTPLKQHVP
jgi:hypothetical protein